MKNTFTYLFIVALAIPFFCTEVVIQYQIKETRKEVKEAMIQGLDRDELVELIFTAEEEKALFWHNEHEFRFNDLMYDIVEVSKQNGSTIYLCFPDHQETKLNIELDRLRSIAYNKHLPRQKSELQLISFFKQLFPPELMATQKEFNSIHAANQAYLESYQSVELEKSTPPPQA